ncbi:MAG TPA: MFS transporter [Candidatus Limnocylindrales bacterium]|nr:MFS transporter [Candidatus Limnocylindrales bacterium]
MSHAATIEDVRDADGRPTAHLPFTHLARLSAYWLGLTAIDSAVSLFVQYRVNFGGFVDTLEIGRALFLIGMGGVIISVLVQPTVGAISDYTVSRWGRRKPWIVIGTLLDFVFLLGIAYANTILALAAFVALLSFSTNIARGPFQGYVPDLVPARQVGTASALVGLMQVLGNVTGFMAANAAAALNNLPLALLAVAIVEFVTMVSVVWRVGNGAPPKPREGRSWLAITREAWGTDILQERSFVWLVASRLFFLMGGGILFNLVIAYLNQVFGLGQEEAAGVNTILLVIVVIANVIAVIPAARLSDRIGRKPVIYASCLIGGIGIGLAALAPIVPVAIVGAAFFGVSAGMFLSVDWALMTDIIPKASAGRFMGISNVATGSSTLLAVASGGIVLDLVNAVAGVGAGPRAAFLLGLAYYVVAAILLRPVKEPPASARGQAVEATVT